MKKIMRTLFSITAISATAHLGAETLSTATMASWRATAIKDTKSMLVVNPMHSLSFNYSEGQKSFNHVDGAFDITIQGQEGASDFKLTSRIVSATLIRANAEEGTDDATLEVGVRWRGQPLSKHAELTLIDTQKGISEGLSNLTADHAFAQSGRVSALDHFNVHIMSAQQNGQQVAYPALNDGYWRGNVNVSFVATWDGQFLTP